jgi:hypothetical protein
MKKGDCPQLAGRFSLVHDLAVAVLPIRFEESFARSMVYNCPSAQAESAWHLSELALAEGDFITSCGRSGSRDNAIPPWGAEEGQNFPGAKKDRR